MSEPRRRARPHQNTKSAGHLKTGRRAYGEQRWDDAYRSLSLADAAAALAADDLERLAWSAGLTGRDDALLKSLERLYHLQIDDGEELAAARSAFWQAMRLLILGETGQAGAWLGRADKLVGDRDCPERGYLLLPAVYRHLGAGDRDAAIEVAGQAIAIGDRHGEADLQALARNLKGRALLRAGRTGEGLALFDEAMLSAAPGQVSPIVTGLVYCNVIDCCQRVYALARSREWTGALANWCAEQPQLVTFAGSCHVHRAEIMQLSGNWADAIAEARHANEQLARAVEPEAVAPAYYQQAEVHRLRGEFAAAEAAYKDASRFGGETQPGLALLRLSQGRKEAAAGAMRPAVTAAAGDRLQQARLLPAHVEIMIAVGDLDSAEAGSRELQEIATAFASECLDAIAAHAKGAILIARDDAAAAIVPLRKAFALWHSFGAPYLAARVRVLVGLACRALGDDDGFAFELEAARATFAELGAKPDLARLESLKGDGRTILTPRETEVLRLVATGKTNKAIAGDLSLSEKTVDRHVSNIFNKLDVPSRAAATAYAYEHKLV
jgi:DNA-binding CsgD family transcriptional regulator/tetratricopeptide (TPR) repeat protein